MKKLQIESVKQAQNKRYTSTQQEIEDNIQANEQQRLRDDKAHGDAVQNKNTSAYRNSRGLNPLQKAELRREVIHMVQKLSRLSKLIEIQGDVLNNVTNDWLEILGSDLRAEDVTSAYRQAMRTRTSTFPLQPFELINAHRQLSNTSSTYVTNGVCSYCRGKETVMIFDPVLKVDVEQKCIGAMHRMEAHV